MSARLGLGIIVLNDARLRLRSVDDHKLDLADLHALILQYGFLGQQIGNHLTELRWCCLGHRL